MNSNYNEHIRHSFDAYGKSVLKRTALGYYQSVKRRGEREVPFSELPPGKLTSLYSTDDYFTDTYTFDVLGANVSVSDYTLAEAISALPVDKREIVLMSYFFDMTDKEIAQRLNMARRTVTDRRASSLQLLKFFLESE